MGTKKGAEPDPVEPRVGANVCYLVINVREGVAPITITINSNTRVDVLLDTAKTMLLESVTKLLATAQPQPQLLVSSPVLEGEEAPPAEAEGGDVMPPADPVAEWQATIERLTEIQEGLAPTRVQELELQEMEHEKVLEIQTHLAENGKGILPHAAKYLVGRMDGEEFKAF